MSKTRNICFRFSSGEVSELKTGVLLIVTWRPVGHDVKDNHELTEVNVTVLETKNLLIQRHATVQMKIRCQNRDFAF